ncbi:MAG: hypothetical protein ACQGVC_25045 [Myxococcota bacterium]
MEESKYVNPGRGGWLLALGLLVLLAAAAPAPARAQGGPPPDNPSGQEDGFRVDDATHLETLDFPSTQRLRDALRFQLDSRFIPDAGLGSGHATEYQPDLRGRFTLPLDDRAVLRISGRAGMTHYSFRGNPDPFFRENLDLYRTRLAVQGAYLLNPDGWNLWREGERWSLLGAVQGSSDFQSGEFDEGLSVLGALSIGYEIPDRLRVALGVSLSTSPQEGGVDPSPAVFVRWNVTDRLTLRSRGLGAQAEYRLSPKLELFVTATRATDSYALKPRDSTFLAFATSPPPRFDDLSLRDRKLLTGVGFEYKLSRALRINTEVGAVAWRHVRVSSDDFGTVVSRSGDPAAYLEVRFEVRP